MARLQVDLDGLARLAQHARDVEAQLQGRPVDSGGSMGQPSLDRALAGAVDVWTRSDQQRSADVGELAYRLEMTGNTYRQADEALARAAQPAVPRAAPKPRGLR